MTFSRRRTLSAIGAAAGALALPALGAGARRPAGPHRQHAGADRAAVGHRAHAQAGGRDLRGAAEQARRPAGPQGAVDRQGRPVQAGPGAHAVRAAGHQRQGRPADGPVRHRRHPVGDGRGPALQQGAGAPHLRHPLAGQVRHAVPGLVARPRRRRPRCPNSLFDMLAASRKPPKTIAIVTSKFPSIHFMSLGGREVAKKRGLQEVLFLEWEFGNRDFGPIAARVKDAKPDLVWMGDIALEGNMLLDAMKKIDYMPPIHFHLYPAPGPMTKSPDGDKALSLTIFEEHPPFTNHGSAAEFVQDLQRARGQGRPARHARGGAGGGFLSPPGRSWRPACAAPTASTTRRSPTGCKKNRVDTIQGRLRFDGPGNYGDDLMKIKQVQNGAWKVVWPEAFAAPGRAAASCADAAPMTLPSFNLLAQSILSGIFIGGLYGLIGLGLGPHLGPAAPDQPVALRAGVPGRLPQLPDGHRVAGRSAAGAADHPAAVLRHRRRHAVAAVALRHLALQLAAGHLRHHGGDRERRSRASGRPTTAGWSRTTTR